VLIAFRSFIDCAASLVIGRGSSDHVDLESERNHWENWIPLLNMPGAFPVTFASITRNSPQCLAHEISSRINVEPQQEIGAGETYADLMRRAGKGVVDDPRQSNVPQAGREALLADAREWVIGQLGPREVSRLGEIYSYWESEIDPLGTVDP